MYSRFMAAYAGFVEHTDAQVGRLIEFLEERDQLDNTVVFLLSDNGGAPEAGVEGRFEHPYRGNMTVGQMFERLDELGAVTHNRCTSAAGAMVSSAPFKYYKALALTEGVCRCRSSSLGLQVFRDLVCAISS